MPKTYFKNKYFIASIVLFLIGIIFENFVLNKLGDRYKIDSTLTNYLDNISGQQEKLLEQVNIDSLFEKNLFNFNFKKYVKKDIYLLVFKEDKLVYWNHNQMVPLEVVNLENGPNLIQTKNGFFQIFTKKIKDYKLISFYPAYLNYPVNNIYFKDHFNPNIPINNNLIRPQAESVIGDNEVYKIVDKIPLIEINLSSSHTNIFITILYAISFILFFIYALTISFKNKLFYFKKFSINLFSYLSIFFLLIYINFAFLFIKNWEFFSPTLASFNQYFNSLGDVFLILLFICSLIIISYLLLSVYISRVRIKFFLQLLISFTISSLLFIFFIYFQENLVINSQIKFDFQILHELNKYSFLGLVLLLFSFIFVVILSRNIRLFFDITNFRKDFIKLIYLNSFTIFILCYFLLNINGFLALSFAIFNGIFLYLFLYKNKIKFKHIFSGISFFALFLTIHFEQINSTKEKETRKSLANKFTMQEDVEKEILLLDIEDNLMRSQIPDVYFFSKSSENKKLQLIYNYTYFKDFINYYEIEYIKFNKDKVTQSNYDFYTLNNWYNSAKRKNISHYFLNIVDDKFLNSYLAKFEISPNLEPDGYLFVLLQPKVKSSQKSALNYFSNSKFSIFGSEYSYALFNNKKLIKSVGECSYFLYLSEDIDTLKDFNFLNKNSFSHLKKKIGEDKVLLVSIENPSIYKRFGAFVIILNFFIIIIVIITGLIYILLIILIRFKEYDNVTKFRVALTAHFRLFNLRKLMMETKIRFALVGLTLIISITILYLTTLLINRNFTDRQDREIEKKLSQIVNEIQVSLSNEDEKPFQILINHISNNYDLDIQLFNKNGYLIQTSNEFLFDKDWFLPIMNNIAYKELSINQNTHFKLTEKIGNLSYISYFTTVFNKNRELEGYIQLPYFQQMDDLNKEFSLFLSTFINFTTFLMLFSFIVSSIIGKSIIKPLKLITSRISDLKIGSKNKPLKWNANDEIGQLVEQYNLMLKKLDISTQKLAKSEREGAWKDMAKQVAHEIKNPLTPMKLHLQRMQRLIENNDPYINEKLKSISNLLIEQINNLSTMAEEFSSFAKMPISITKVCNLSEIVKYNVMLFNAELENQIELKLCSDIIPIYVDHDQMSRVFNNIIKNAIQAKKEDLPIIIQINCMKRGEIVRISITDNGKGIPEEFQKDIFVPNFSTKTSGMGIGLSICKNIVESFQGNITFESTENVGTTFHVEIPIYFGKES